MGILEDEIKKEEILKVAVSLGATALGLILAYAYYNFGRRSIQVNIAKVGFFGAMIWYVKINTVGTWLTIFRFSVVEQFSSPRKFILFALPVASPLIGIVTLHAIS
jgi:hypothetical protein